MMLSSDDLQNTWKHDFLFHFLMISENLFAKVLVVEYEFVGKSANFVTIFNIYLRICSFNSTFTDEILFIFLI